MLSIARAAILVVAVWTSAANTAALASDLADFNAAVEAASAHNRATFSYLRTGNTDQALLEIERLRAAWDQLVERFAAKRPDVFDGNPLYGTL